MEKNKKKKQTIRLKKTTAGGYTGRCSLVAVGNAVIAVMHAMAQLGCGNSNPSFFSGALASRMNAGKATLNSLYSGER